MPDEAEIVEAAAQAAEDAIFAAYDHSELADFDVTIKFVDRELTVDVYLDATAETEEERERERRVVEDAIVAGRNAVDVLLEE